MTTKLISQGIEGCLFYPKYKCDGSIKHDSYASKITKIENNNELYISKLIQQISGYKEHFIVQEKKCIPNNKIVVSILNKNKDCELSSKYKYNILYSTYLKNSQTLSSYLKKEYITINKFISMYESIINKLNIINNHDIIHMDLHLNNILIDKNESIFIIDFGSSIDLKKTNSMNYLKNNIYISDITYYLNPIEYFILYYYIHHNNINNKIIKKIIEKYYNKIHKIFPNKDDYINRAYKTLKNTKLEKLISYAYTWDKYKLSMLSIILYEKDFYTDIFYNKLLLMIDPNPNLRSY